MADSALNEKGALDEFLGLANELPDAFFKAKRSFQEYEDLIMAKLKEHAKAPRAEAFIERSYVRPQLAGTIFVGHKNTDLDSIAGAIGAAHVFNGIAARAETNFNGEIKAALEFAGMEVPPVFAEIPDVDSKYVCLVDHNEVKQMPDRLAKAKDRTKRIVGVIDHHAIASSFETNGPLYMDIEPWGSMSSIIAHTYVRQSVTLPKDIAKMLACAIISDTLMLKSVTTTNADRFALAMLAKWSEIEDVNELATTLFRAKTDWIISLGAYEMIRGDQKDFEVQGRRFSISVLEVTDMKPVLKIAQDIIFQLRIFKYQRGNDEDGEHHVDKELHAAVVFVIDVVNSRSVMLVCGHRERYLAEKAFQGTFEAANSRVTAPSKYVAPEQTMLRLPEGMVSRKKQFLPAISKCLSEDDVPDWFTDPHPFETLPVERALQRSETPKHNSIQVLWDNLRQNVSYELVRANSAKDLDALNQEEPEEARHAATTSGKGKGKSRGDKPRKGKGKGKGKSRDVRWVPKTTN